MTEGLTDWLGQVIGIYIFIYCMKKALKEHNELLMAVNFPCKGSLLSQVCASLFSIVLIHLNEEFAFTCTSQLPISSWIPFRRSPRLSHFSLSVFNFPFGLMDFILTLIFTKQYLSSKDCYCTL